MSIADRYSAILRRRYALFGKPVSLTISAIGKTIALRMIDYTRGLQIGSGEVEIDTIGPSATVMERDLSSAGVSIQDILGECFTLNDYEWQINSTAELPGPHGQAEIRLMLVDANA